MKTIVATLGALVLGVVAGAVGLTTYYQSQGDAVESHSDMEQQIAQLKKQLSEQEERLQRLQWENEAFQEELSREPINFFTDTAQARQAPEFSPEMLGGFGMEGMAALGGREDEEEDDRDDDELTEEERQAREERRLAREERRAQWAERRNEWVERAQDNVYRLLDEELMKTNDPLAQERIYALGEYTDYFFNIGDRMRQAQSDEERQAIRQEAGQAMREAGRLMEDHRQFMLNEIAGQYTQNPAQQQALTEALQETLQSPMFQARGLPMAGPMMGGGGGGRGGGGFTGRGGGGGRGGN